MFILVWSMTFISNELRTSFKWVTCKLYSTLKTKVAAIDVETSEMKQCSSCFFQFKPIEACKPTTRLNHNHSIKPRPNSSFDTSVSPAHLVRVTSLCAHDSLQKGSMGNALLLVGWHQPTFDGQLCYLGPIWVSR